MHIEKKFILNRYIISLIFAAGITFTGCQDSTFDDFYYRVPNDYTSTVPTGGPIEEKYLDMGLSEWKCMKSEQDSYIDYSEIYYPEELENSDSDTKYPLVIFVNGTGVACYRYPALFKHLASWGFIAVGNDDRNSNKGKSVDDTMSFILCENEDEGSVLFHKIDLDRIGITGHSQGGAGVFNAVTVGKYASYYKCASVLSPVGKEISDLLGWTYDATKINIPVIIFTGTKGRFENDIVISAEELNVLYSDLNGPKVMARKTGYTHRESHYVSDGYITAWFRYYLMGDVEAAPAFFGDSPELMANELYEGQTINLGE